MSTPPLAAADLYRFYHAEDSETLALRGVSLEVAAGEMVAVTGPSGSGKSTLLMCLGGLDDPDGGTVRICGERLSRRPEADRARIRARSIGVLFQSNNLVGHLSLHDNVALAQRVADGGGDRGARAEILEQMGLTSRRRALPSQLSGGELARAGLAVALVNRPAVVLADEPTGELDTATAQAVLELLKERACLGAAVVVVTHDPAVADRADRQLRLRDGAPLQ
jgi:putative ABC transport system ATP-binding protein